MTCERKGAHALAVCAANIQHSPHGQGRLGLRKEGGPGVGGAASRPRATF